MLKRMTYGEIVKRLINDNKVSITDMSKKTGIKRTTIYSIINQNQKKSDQKHTKKLQIILMFLPTFF